MHAFSLFGKFLKITLVLLSFVFVALPGTIAQQDSVNTRGIDQFHRVQKGETLYSISRSYNVSVQDLMQWNNMSPEQAGQIKTGTVLRISGTGPTPQPQYAQPSAPAGSNSQGGIYADDDVIIDAVEQNVDEREKVLAQASNTSADQASRLLEETRMFAVVIGISEYQAVRSLRYPDDDAYQFYAFLRSPEGGAVPYENIVVLTNENATHANIHQQMSKVYAQADENDIVVFYFAGHGIKGAFIPVDYDGGSNTLPFEEILGILNQTKARLKVLVADACYSGSFEDFTTRGIDDAHLLSANHEGFTIGSEGSIGIMSTAEEELAIEDRGLHQGVFTYFLIRGLEGQADVNRDHVVTLAEIYQFLYGKVSEYSRGSEHPSIMGSGAVDGQIPLSVLPLRRRGLY